MSREDVNDLIAFLAVARERSFTRAAAKLGVSQSALSEYAPLPGNAAWASIDAELAALSALREKPAGTLRITTGEPAADTILPTYGGL